MSSSHLAIYLNDHLAGASLDDELERLERRAESQRLRLETLRPETAVNVLTTHEQGDRNG
ncbi:MAG: hypothetical protein JHC95_13685 [Solirubrobacteraceae bacterium]|nr:hypothetical protein [Solirubrobacteraceae bacterium]